MRVHPLHLVSTEQVTTTSGAWRRARAIVHKSGVLPALEALLHKNVGAPRVFTAEAAQVLLLAHGQTPQHRMHYTALYHRARGLTVAQRRSVGIPTGATITYRMVESTYSRIAAAWRDGGLPVPGEDRAMTADEYATRLLVASRAEGVPATASIAIDSTDYETWARRRSWASKVDLDIDPDNLPPDGEPRIPRGSNEPGWPCIGDDGRWQHSLDPTARDGYRSGKNRGRSEIFLGWDWHLAIESPRHKQGPTGPGLILGMVLDPAGSHKGDAGIHLIDAIRAAGHEISEVQADRGYSYTKPDRWALPVKARGIRVAHDLHTQQRGTHPGPRPGTVWIDGAVVTDHTPAHLHDLPGFAIGMSSTERAELHRRYDQRAAWAFVPHSAPDDDGHQKWKGPARAGKIRCPNYPPSMRLGWDRPETDCAPGAPCACAAIITISPTEHAWERQRHIYGTTTWAKAYHRRNHVEAANAETNTHRANVTRGHSRVFGTDKNVALLAATAVGINITMQRDWAAKRALPDPWAVALNERILQRPQPTKRSPKRRQRRRISDVRNHAPTHATGPPGG